MQGAFAGQPVAQASPLEATSNRYSDASVAQRCVAARRRQSDNRNAAPIADALTARGVAALHIAGLLSPTP